MDLEIPDLTIPALSADAASGTGTVVVTDATFDRLAEIEEATGEPKALRVAVLGGGCSGFQYEFALEDDPADTDLILEGKGQRVFVDAESLPFLAGSVIDFKDELIGARFEVENPNATSTCGCGTSFSL
ncbi:MAG: iron-sulfur cluster assembly accessory protein [Pseudomonadota bacterium]